MNAAVQGKVKRKKLNSYKKAQRNTAIFIFNPQFSWVYGLYRLSGIEIVIYQLFQLGWAGKLGIYRSPELYQITSGQYVPDFIS